MAPGRWQPPPDSFPGLRAAGRKHLVLPFRLANASAAMNDVHDFWNAASCGEQLYFSGDYAKQAEARYALEPYIAPFAGFDNWGGKRVLEIGVGMGADHERFARSGAIMSGIDLTERAIEHTAARLRAAGLQSHLQVADVTQRLPFPDETFDLVYSWGVLHHSTDTPWAVVHAWRALKFGGTLKAMIYNKWSLVGLMLWARYGLAGLKTLEQVYSRHLESPGTKAYTPNEARNLFGCFDHVHVETALSHGDLLSSGAGQRHRGPLLSTARQLWPREFLKRFPQLGLFMMITAEKRARPTG